MYPLTGPISIKETEFVLKSLPQKENNRVQMAPLVNSNKR